MPQELYRNIISPILDKIGHSEEMHVVARNALNIAERLPGGLQFVEKFAFGYERLTDFRLQVRVGSVDLDNPVMVGAGWDKTGVAVSALHQLGASAVEVGSVLAYPQQGNDKPRQFMIGPGVALNRLGFNSPGMEIVAQNLKRYRGSGIPIGISLGKNKLIPDTAAPQMHAVVAERLYDDAAYFVINVSSPNTPGLRRLQDKEPLTDIVQAVNETMDRRGRRKPLFVKIAPDMTNDAVDDVIEVVSDNNLTGIIATNTTVNPDIKMRYGREGTEMGGISGDDSDFRRMATEKVAHIYKTTKGQMEIIGVGGVKDGGTALAKIMAGASTVQVVTAIRGIGPTVFGRINRSFALYMESNGLQNIRQIRGAGISSNLWQV